MHSQDPGKRIPTSIRSDTKLFGRYTLTDVAVAAFPGVAVALATQLLVPSSLEVVGVAVRSITLPLAGIAMGGGALFVYLTPEYTTSIDWLATFAGYTASSNRQPHGTARTTTQIERVYPERGAIERRDGALFGMVEVQPPSMALATSEEWQRKAEAFEEFLNTTVEFPIQLYSTTRSFPVEEYVAQYEQRLDDPDVESNPRLAELVEGYVEWYVEDCRRRPTTIREHYVVVPVRPDEIRFDRGGFADQLAALPVVGVLLHAVFAPPRVEERQAMIDALDDRLHRVASGIRDIEGCEAHRVPVEDAVGVVSDFWQGEEPEYEDLDRVLRTRPLVATGGEDA